MNRSTRIIASASIVLAPLMFGIGDQLRMAAEPPTGAGLINNDYGVQAAIATLASVDAHRGLFLAASYLAYGAMLLTVPALLAIWALSIERAPRWAWAGAGLAALYALGQAVHLIGYFGMAQAFSAHGDLATAAALWVAVSESPFVLALFAPLYLVGLLAAFPQAIGLWRSGVLPPWACLAVIGGTVLFLVAGSTPWSSAIWMVLVVAGLAPAARAVLVGRGHRAAGAGASLRHGGAA